MRYETGEPGNRNLPQCLGGQGEQNGTTTTRLFPRRRQSERQEKKGNTALPGKVVAEEGGSNQLPNLKFGELSLCSEWKGRL